MILFAPMTLQESYSYRDPITEFVECLYVNFDFDMAQQKLLECEKVSDMPHRVIIYLMDISVPAVMTGFLSLCCLSQVLDNDFFLVACKADFIENARLSIFETFCRIHHCISIRYITSS